MKKGLLAVVCILMVVSASAGELAIGAKAPGFTLTNAIDGKPVSFKPGDGKISVVVFTCNSCPYSKAFEDRIVALGSEYGKKGVRFFAVNPNDDNQYAAEKMERMKQRMVTKKYSFPYLKDGSSETARAYGARVTPHVFVVDGKGAIAYRGYVDDSARVAEREDTGLTNALDNMLAKKPVSKSETKAFGCSIKWKTSR